MKTVAFHNLGCKVNSYEMEVMQQKLQEKGYLLVPFDTKADIYVVNTCTVTNMADRKSRQMLHRAKKKNPDGIVVAVGCYVQTDLEGARNDEAVDIVIGNNHKSEIAEIIDEFYEKHMADSTNSSGRISDLTTPVSYESCGLVRSNERTRVDIKIQDGCNQFCSYCAIPIARGRIRSREVGETLSEIMTLARQGYKEVVLTGIHLSSYGLDLHPDDDGNIPSYNQMAREGEYTNIDLLDLIDRVSDIEGISRIRLGSLEPRAITDEFLRRICANEKVCPHFHLSLQSGCDETLHRMNRHYSTTEFAEKVAKIREYYDHPAITTDIIVGFPGETEEEFEETANFVDKIEFYETHIFKYSKRKGTAAATYPNQVSEDVKSVRSEQLIKLGAVKGKLFRKQFIGSLDQMLAEEVVNIGGKTYLTGYNKEYVRMAVRADEEGASRANELIIGRVTGMLTDEIMLMEL